MVSVFLTNIDYPILDPLGNHDQSLCVVRCWLDRQSPRSDRRRDRTEILPGLRQLTWDLMVVDEANSHVMSPPVRKTARDGLGGIPITFHGASVGDMSFAPPRVQGTNVVSPT
jgi:hypothetical protein